MNVRHRELNPDTVAHLSRPTNRARRRLTSLIETNALTTTPDHQPLLCKHLSLKLRLLDARVLYVLTYCAESLTLTTELEKQIDV